MMRDTDFAIAPDLSLNAPSDATVARVAHLERLLLELRTPLQTPQHEASVEEMKAQASQAFQADSERPGPQK